jgi:nicotinamidase-related amidase
MTDAARDRPPAPEAVEALVVLDLQNDFLRPPELDAVRGRLVDVTNDLARHAHDAGALVVEVRTEHRADGSTWTLSMQEDQMGVVIEGTEGAQLLPELDLHPHATITKTRDSAFVGTPFGDVLERAGVGTIALVGVTTDLCILMTAADAFAPDLRVVLVEYGLAAEPRKHESAVKYLTESYRQEVVTSTDVTFVAPPGLDASTSARGIPMSPSSTVEPC